MRPALLALAVFAASPAEAQIRAIPQEQLIREGTPGTEEAPATAPPVNLRPTQLLRCADGKGGVSLQDTPCKPASTTAGTPPASALPEVIDLSALTPRPQVEAPAPRAEEAAPNRWTQGLLNGAWKLALLLAACYALFRLARHVRERLQQRFPPPEIPSRIPRRTR